MVVQFNQVTSRILPGDQYYYACVERDHCEIKALSKLRGQSNLKTEVSLWKHIKLVFCSHYTEGLGGGGTLKTQQSQVILDFGNHMIIV